MTINQHFISIQKTALLFGISGGIALIIAQLITTNGPAQLIPYPFFLFGALFLNALADKSIIAFNRLFKCALLTFLIMSIIMYLYIEYWIYPERHVNFSSHLFSISMMALFGVAASLIAAAAVKILSK
jgi:hypothetical protein